MQLSTLLQDDFALSSSADRNISGLTLDSRQIKPGDLFFAIKGKNWDGRLHIADAISRGAKAVIVEGELESLIDWQGNIPIISICQLQKKIGPIAARFYDKPSQALHMIGVTGTSGKTSCTHFLAQALQALDIPCGIIGTLGAGFSDTLVDTGLTTPDAITLQGLLQQFVKQHTQVVAMEVSSHSIHQERINGIEFDIGIFTNLTQDHLDYHQNMQIYAAVKRRFLSASETKHVIINADDDYGCRWINELHNHKFVAGYGFKQPPHLPSHIPFLKAHSIQSNGKGMKAEIESPWGQGFLSLPLIGHFNLSNSLAVLSALCVYGIPFESALKTLSQLKAVSGRMQILGGQGKPLVVVDYAHKPDALEKVLQTLRSQVTGKLICVFGCGGERDRDKRPLMARIAEKLADQVIITNDNPRREDPLEIMKDILAGFQSPNRVLVELDRSNAIKNSIQLATAKDCVLIAGKGGERYQQIGDKKLPFDDVKKVNDYLAEKR